MQILGLIIIGIVIGILARLVLPGRQRIGVGLTIVLGIAGALDAGPVHDKRLLVGGEILPGHIEADAAPLRRALELHQTTPVVRLGPRLDGAGRNRE